MTSETIVTETSITETSANPIVPDQSDRSGDPDVAQSGASITRAAGIVSLGNILSSALGLIRETVKSHLFGASGFVSAYNVAAIVPSMLYDLLVGGLVSSALVPMFSELAAKKDRGELWRLLSLLLSVAVVFLSLAVLAIELFAPQVARFMAGGFDDQLLQVTINLLRITVPAVLFLSLSSVLSGALYALKRFAFPAFSAPLYNGMMIVVAILLADRFGIAAMALGLLAGSILQVVFQLPALRGATLRWRFDPNDPALRKMLKLYTPVLGGLIIGQVAIALSLNLASRTGASGIALMDYPTRLIQFPLGLIVSAVSIAILPSLSRHAALSSTTDFKATLAQGLRLVLVLIIPSAVGLAVLAPNIVQLLFEHGAFTPADTQAVTIMLWLYLIGLIFAGVDQPLVFAFYARKDTLTPAVVGLICNVGIYLFMAMVPPALTQRPLQVTDLAIANSVQWMSHALIMLWLLRYRLGGLGGHGLGRLALKAVIGSLAMALGAYGAISVLVAVFGERSIAREAVGVIGAAAIGAGIYLGAMLLMRAQEIRSIWRILLRRRVA
ncbi:MAG: murein biosynthesis integral membrane protein MurJ [Anaerolineae bacterium]